MADKNSVNFLKNMAIAESYATPFNNQSQQFIQQHHHMNGYNPLSHEVTGRYGPVTQMTMAIASLMIENLPFSEHAIATALLKTYQQDPRQGYNSALENNLTHASTGHEFLNNCAPYQADNSALMRAIPCGLHSKIEDVIFTAKTQAKTTNNTPQSVESSVFIAVLAHALYHLKMPPQKAIQQALKHVTKEPKKRAKQNNGSSIDALSIIAEIIKSLNHQSLSANISNAVLKGGECAIVASVAVGLASLSPYYSQDIPQILHENLEDDPFGGDYLTYIGEESIKIATNT